MGYHSDSLNKNSGLKNFANYALFKVKFQHFAKSAGVKDLTNIMSGITTD